MFKRIMLFLLVNALVVLTISILLNLLGIQPYLTDQGIDYTQLALFALIWGMAGSLISLALSKQMAKWVMGVVVVDPNTLDPQLKSLLSIVTQLAKRAGLPVTPEVGIFSSNEVNAFATGPSRSSALVAVSSALLKKMDSNEVEAVLAHEISHVANGDMVTMTLLQGIVNAFVIFLARAIALLLSRGSNSENNSSQFSYGSYMLIVFLLETVLMFFGMIVVATYSRHREFRADEGGARLTSKEKMIHALQRLQQTIGVQDPRSSKQQSFQAFKIASPGGIMKLFATHPPLAERIEHIRRL